MIESPISLRFQPKHLLSKTFFFFLNFFIFFISGIDLAPVPVESSGDVTIRRNPQDGRRQGEVGAEQ